jgi:hypothetical protein
MKLSKHLSLGEQFLNSTLAIAFLDFSLDLGYSVPQDFRFSWMHDHVIMGLTDFN